MKEKKILVVQPGITMHKVNFLPASNSLVGITTRIGLILTCKKESFAMD